MADVPFDSEYRRQCHHRSYISASSPVPRKSPSSDNRSPSCHSYRAWPFPWSGISLPSFHPRIWSASATHDPFEMRSPLPEHHNKFHSGKHNFCRWHCCLSRPPCRTVYRQPFLLWNEAICLTDKRDHSVNTVPSPPVLFHNTRQHTPHLPHRISLLFQVHHDKFPASHKSCPFLAFLP